MFLIRSHYRFSVRRGETTSPSGKWTTATNEDAGNRRCSQNETRRRRRGEELLRRKRRRRRRCPEEERRRPRSREKTPSRRRRSSFLRCAPVRRTRSYGWRRKERLCCFARKCRIDSEKKTLLRRDGEEEEEAREGPFYAIAAARAEVDSNGKWVCRW